MQSLVKVLYFFVQLAPLKQVRLQTGLSFRTVRDIFYTIRIMMLEKANMSQGEGKLGGRGRVVCIDETYFTMRKRNRAGFVGQPTRGNVRVVGIAVVSVVLSC